MGQSLLKGYSYSSLLVLFRTLCSEKVIGVHDVRNEARMSIVMKMKEVQDALLEEEDEEPAYAEPTAKLAVEGKLDEILSLVSSTKEKKS